MLVIITSWPIDDSLLSVLLYWPRTAHSKLHTHPGAMLSGFIHVFHENKQVQPLLKFDTHLTFVHSVSSFPNNMTHTHTMRAVTYMGHFGVFMISVFVDSMAVWLVGREADKVRVWESFTSALIVCQQSLDGQMVIYLYFFHLFCYDSFIQTMTKFSVIIKEKWHNVWNNKPSLFATRMALGIVYTSTI